MQFLHQYVKLGVGGIDENGPTIHGSLQRDCLDVVCMKQWLQQQLLFLKHF